MPNPASSQLACQRSIVAAVCVGVRCQRPGNATHTRGSAQISVFLATNHAAASGYLEALDKYIAATNTHDFGRVRPLLHPDVVFRFSDADCVTMPAVQQCFENAWSIVREERYAAVDVDWRIPIPNVAIASYTYRWAGFINGEARNGEGRATNVFVAAPAGGWLLAHEHLSALA